MKEIGIMAEAEIRRDRHLKFLFIQFLFFIFEIFILYWAIVD